MCVMSLNKSYEFKEKCKNGFEEINEMMSKSNLNLIICETEKPIVFEEIDIKPKLDPLLEQEEDDLKLSTIKDLIVKEEITEVEKVSRKRYQCVECNESFYFPKQLRLHKKTHIKIPEYSCTYCELKFPKLQKVRDHVREAHGHKCKICGKEFATNSRLTFHIKTVHTEDGQYECQICFKKMKFRHNLKRHMKSVHDQEKKHFCNSCPAAFFEIGSLKTHMGSHVLTRDFICNICTKDFKTKLHLSIHMKSHEPPTPNTNTKNKTVTYKKKSQAPRLKNQFICQYCGKLFNYKQCYEVHIRIHTKQNPFKCDTCDRGFRNKQVLAIHKRTHTGEKPYKCSICNVSFRQSMHLKYHAVIHTGEKNYKCDICGISVAYKSSLSAHHKNVHQGLRPYECTICEKRFFTNGNLKKHLVNHNK